MNKIFKVGFLLVLSWSFGCTNTTLSSKQIDALRNVSIGNGLTFHPSDQLLLISKPSDELDQRTGKHLYKIYQLEWRGNHWSDLQELPFNSKYNNYHPVFSPDGKWIYFNSNRPVPGDSLLSEKVNIWRVPFQEGEFGSPEYLTAINTESHESYPSISSDGDLYFNSDRPGGLGSMDIYRSAFNGNSFEAPVLVQELNSPDSENDLTISPDGNYLILNRYHFNTGEISLYVSYKKNEVWTTPTLLDGINESNVWELTPTIDPYRSYFFYEKENEIEIVKIDTIKMDFPRN